MADEQLQVGQVEGRPGVTLVTQENMEEWIDSKIPPKTNGEDTDPEAQAAAELAGLEAKQAEEKSKAAEPKEGDIDGANVFFNGKWVKKHDFAYRVHVKTEEARKEAQSKIDAAAAEAKAAREAAQQAQRERDELRQKYEPPAAEKEPAPEPHPSQFTDINEYAKALKEWTAETTRRDDAKKAAEKSAAEERSRIATTFRERQEKARAEIPDYVEKVNAADVVVSDPVRDAILESEHGPQIVYHLATHPEVAAGLQKMTIAKQLVEFGRLEAGFAKDATKAANKSEEKGTQLAEISKAPAPITPLKGGNAIPGSKVDANGNWTGSFEEYKAARREGKIK